MLMFPPEMWTLGGVAVVWVVKVLIPEADVQVLLPAGSIAYARHQYWVLADKGVWMV